MNETKNDGVPFSVFFFIRPDLHFPMSNYSLPSQSPEQGGNVSQVLDAVRSFIHEQRDSSIQYGSPKAFKNARVLGQMNKPSGFIAKVGLTPRGVGTTSTPPDYSSASADENIDFVNLVYSNNQELSTILNLLKTSFPELLNEALLLVEEERSRRIQLESELEIVREKWKADVARQNEIISQKTEIISRMSRANGEDPIGLIDLQKQLAEAHSEINELREVIRAIK